MHPIYRKPKMVAMATSLSSAQHLCSGLPSNTMIPWAQPPTRAHNSNGISIGSAVFAQLTAECPSTLQWDAPFPSKLPLLMGNLDPHLTQWFPGTTRVLKPSGISIGSAVFAGLTSVTDRQTDKPTDRPTDRPR